MLKKRVKKVIFYLDWESFSFYICTPQEREFIDFLGLQAEGK
jgi:hypothetical protein